MSISLLPKLIAKDLTALTPALLARRGIRLLMLDFDNTIVPYTTDVPGLALEQWLEDMGRAGIQLCVVSNSKKERVKRFCAARGLDCLTHARKPSPRKIRSCLEHYAVAPSQAALAGDQIYTDVLGANLAGGQSILVSAINNHNFWLKARHGLELPFIALARGRKI